MEMLRGWIRRMCRRGMKRGVENGSPIWNSSNAEKKTMNKDREMELSLGKSNFLSLSKLTTKSMRTGHFPRVRNIHRSSLFLSSFFSLFFSSFLFLWKRRSFCFLILPFLQSFVSNFPFLCGRNAYFLYTFSYIFLISNPSRVFSHVFHKRDHAPILLFP